MGGEQPAGRQVGVILDAVGTLIYAEPPVAMAYAAAALGQGISIEPSELKHRFAVHFVRAEAEKSAGSLATDEARERSWWRQIVASVMPELPDLDAGFVALWEHFGRPEAWRCYPDAAPAIQALAAAGKRIGIASNFDSRLRRVVAGLPELALFGDGLIISSEVGYRKPHRAMYEAACASMGLPAGAVVSVGDDLRNDIEGACAAGLAAIWLDRSAAGAEAAAVVARALPDGVARVTSLVAAARLLC